MSAVGGAATSFALSSDGVRVAYDVTGRGPMLLLLHGGGQSRHVWHELGYVERLHDHFTVVTIDIRGNGESDNPIDVEAYSIDHQKGNIPSTVAQLIAILNWPAVQPSDLQCPTLWVMGTGNETAMRSLKEHQQLLSGTKVTAHLLPGLAHDEELKRVDDVLAPMRDFTPAP